MESPEQEIEHNKQMAREYYRISNIFTILCCCTGIPFLLIGTYEYNSKAKRCWRRIRALEEQKQGTQEVFILHCRNCGHGVKEIIAFCPLCGEKIDESYIEEQKQRVIELKTDKESESISQVDPEKLAMKRRRNRGKASIGIAIFVLVTFSWASIYLSPVTAGGCLYCIIGIILSITIIKQEKKLAVIGIVMNAVSILIVVVMIILTHTVFFTSFFIPV